MLKNENIMSRIKHTLRTLKKHPGLTSINVLGMALGLVAAGIILGFVYQEYHYDAGYSHSDRVYRVILQNAGKHEIYTYPPMADALEADYPKVEAAVNVHFFYGYLSFTTGESKFNEQTVIFADPEFFTLFSFLMEKGDPAKSLRDPKSVVISQKAARKYFGSDNPVGKQILVGGKSEYTVTGVYQDFKPNSNFHGDIVLPISDISELTQVWLGMGWENPGEINTFVLLSEGTDPNAFTRKAKNFITNYKEDSPHQVSLQPLQDIHVDQQTGWESKAQANVTYLHILLTVAGIILIISSINFLFLYIGTIAQQQVGTGIKKICGATKYSLFLDHFREVLMLMILSSALGMFFYLLYNEWAVPHFEFLPSIVFFDYKIVLILVIAVLLIAVVSSLYPSIIIASQKPIDILQKIRATLPGRARLIHVLVVGQFVLCTVLIASTLLIYHQVQFMEQKDLGYDTEQLISIPLNMHLGAGIYNDQFDVFANELIGYTGISQVTMAISQPTSGKFGMDEPNWEGKPEDKHVPMNWSSVFYKYFETIGIDIVKGRSFQPNHPGDEVNWDTREAAFILNEQAVKEMELTDPIGTSFEIWEFKGQVIGVAEDYNFQSLHSGIRPMFFWVNPVYLNEILIRFDPSVPNVTTNIETVWKKFVPEYPLEYRYVSDQVDRLYSKEQNLVSILNIFSMLGIIIACMGLLTLTLLSTSQRTKEIGIRKVLGSTVTGIVRLLVRDYLKWVAVATLIAWPLAWYVMQRWLQNFAYKIDLSVWPFLLAGVLAFVIAMLTVSWQAIQAALANPVDSLRSE